MVTMIDRAIKLILISLLVFTPIAFCSIDFWTVSPMELGILFIFLVGVFESLNGMFESFNGYHQALNIRLDDTSVAGTFISRFFTSSNDFKSRWEVWVDTVRMVKDFPLFGSGLGTFALVFPMYRSFHITGVTGRAENDFLQLASDVGLMGIGLLLILFVAFFYKAVSGIRSLSEGNPKRYVGIGGLVGILALMFHGLVEANIQIPANAFLFTFIFAMVTRLPYLPRSLTQMLHKFSTLRTWAGHSERLRGEPFDQRARRFQALAGVHSGCYPPLPLLFHNNRRPEP